MLRRPQFPTEILSLTLTLRSEAAFLLQCSFVIHVKLEKRRASPQYPGRWGGLWLSSRADAQVHGA